MDFKILINLVDSADAKQMIQSIKKIKCVSYIEVVKRRHKDSNGKEFGRQQDVFMVKDHVGAMLEIDVSGNYSQIEEYPAFKKNDAGYTDVILEEIVKLPYACFSITVIDDIYGPGSVATGVHLSWANLPKENLKIDEEANEQAIERAAQTAAAKAVKLIKKLDDKKSSKKKKAS